MDSNDSSQTEDIARPEPETPQNKQMLDTVTPQDCFRFVSK